MTVATATLTKVPNYVNGQWVDSKATEWLDVTNPATGEVIAQTPLSNAAEVGSRDRSGCRPPFRNGGARPRKIAFSRCLS